ncbi:MAG: CDP-alcohol phosphatidyltransferase family protein [Bdellovibrionota bacterium]
MKKYVADSLSFGNLLCGAGSIVASSTGRFNLAMILVFVGALLDGLDGAAARVFGGTRFGVIADDLADGVTYGIAPGAALYFLLPGIEGIVLGITYALFTICRLVYFTLNKDSSDPNYFAGVPSPTGGAIVMSTVVSLGQYPALVGLLVGAACAFMISFDTAYRHMGRLLAYRRKALLYIMPIYVVLAIAAYLLGLRFLVAIILAANLGYALFPVAAHFRDVLEDEPEPATAQG